ncbi:YbaL family putative K(+) efflux transporter [Methylotenera sp.]|jgi:CPA2 family monovalent cation:H+ antiporter-2|uniref:YbaL family putative K(+) efflux transporter n=1 Tax=Methylotenera sp. TaxID=2051956 RepID=UPI002734C667|nr:YbaL family putative K(+) efflux transporter [Methylotenera sp.]MDP3777104.1 YbaL family putative K(+) efflux transporter [Methylotenera sp.]
MEHNVTLITTIAAGFGLALIFGFIAERLKLSALVGYLVAGILIGPATPGFVADAHIASQLSEIGVMLLMFGVGLHFSIEDLMSVKRIAIPGAIVQMTIATLLGMYVSSAWGWTFGEGLVFGLSLSCASTVVLLKALESRNLMKSINAKITIGWLVVEDLITVLVLVLLPPLASLLGGTALGNESVSIWQTIGLTLLQVAAFIVIMLGIGKRLLPWMLWHIAKTGSRELFTLAVISAAIGIAYGASALFNVSFALGAFFAGMVMRESEFSHRAAQESLPLRDAFAVLFFVSVGMLFQPSILIDKPMSVLAVVAVIVVGKSVAAMAITLAFRYPLNTALVVAASLAQIGEFSFILAGLGASLGILPAEGMSLILAGALISIAINPLIFSAINPFKKWLVGLSGLASDLEKRVDPFAELPMSTERKYLEGQVVLVGYGRVGRRIAQELTAHDIPFVVAEQNREVVEGLRKKGIPAVSGNASEPSVLIQAHIANASMLVVATPDTIDVRKMVDTAKALRPEIRIVLRTHNEDESELLRKDNLGTVFYGEEELANGMCKFIVSQFAPK